MKEKTIIADDLIRAYRATSYGVEGPEPFALRIGRACEPLQELYRTHRCNCAAYVTAFNPYSEPKSPEGNAESQARLRADLIARGLRFLPGVGQGADTQWPGELSFLVLGLSLQSARVLGASYAQNAIVWCGSDAVPQLVLLR